MATDNIKYTKRDNFSDIRDYIERDGDLDPETQDRWLAFIDRELELMGQRIEKQKKYQKIHDAAHDELSDGIFNLLLHSSSELTLRDIAEKIEGATPQKVTYRLSKMYDEGFITKETKSIDTPNGKRRATVYMASKDLHSQG